MSLFGYRSQYDDERRPAAQPLEVQIPALKSAVAELREVVLTLTDEIRTLRAEMRPASKAKRRPIADLGAAKSEVATEQINTS